MVCPDPSQAREQIGSFHDKRLGPQGNHVGHHRRHCRSHHRRLHDSVPSPVGTKTASLAIQCAVTVRDRCLDPKDFWAGFSLITPRGLDDAHQKQMGIRRQVLEGLVERTLLVKMPSGSDHGLRRRCQRRAAQGACSRVVAGAARGDSRDEHAAHRRSCPHHAVFRIRKPSSLTTRSTDESFARTPIAASPSSKRCSARSSSRLACET